MSEGASLAVTVVVPTYNACFSVARAIDSALGQTYGNLEVLVVDDASADGTPALIARRYRNDPRVRIMRLERNAGPASVRNVGIAAARGEWIAPLDADDAWRPSRLGRLLAHSEDVDAVFDNLVAFDADLEAETGVLFPTFFPDVLTIEALVAPDVSGSRYDFGYLKPLVRRRFLLATRVRYDETLRTSEDLVFYLTMLIEGARTRMVDEALYIYTTPIGHASGGLSASSTRPRDDEVRRALADLLKRYADRIGRSAAQAIRERIAFLGRIGPIADFYYARRKRDYATMALLFARHPSVQREAMRKAVRLLRGRQLSSSHGGPQE